MARGGRLGSPSYHWAATIADGVTVDDPIRGSMEEDRCFSFAHLLAISTLAPSIVPSVSAPFSMNFMLPVPEASFGGNTESAQTGRAGRDKLFGGGDVVVFHEHHLKPILPGSAALTFERVRAWMSFAMVAGAAALAPKMPEAVRRQVAALDLVILVDEVQQIQLLALVLMQTLDWMSNIASVFTFLRSGCAAASRQGLPCWLFFTAVSSLSTASRRLQRLAAFSNSAASLEAGADALFQLSGRGGDRTPAASGGT